MMGGVFDEDGACLDMSAKLQLETVGRQVVEFARMRQRVAIAVSSEGGPVPQ